MNAVEYLGRKEPRLEDLCTAVINREAGTRFNLADRIIASWRTIGLRLGLQLDVLDSIESNRVDNAKRLLRVFGQWLENASQLPHHHDYPLSWQGLNTLLEDIGKLEVARQYFEFLDSMP